jgi:hypothetical protein
MPASASARVHFQGGAVASLSLLFAIAVWVITIVAWLISRRRLQASEIVL